jgi:predicted SAM-dependent methyltransferase
LHLGSGPRILAGWLSTNVHGILSDVVYVDVTKRLPLRASLFDDVFTGHIMEHVSFADAQNKSAEGFRVLEPRGGIRGRMPDLARNLSPQAARFRSLQVMDSLSRPPA